MMLSLLASLSLLAQAPTTDVPPGSDWDCDEPTRQQEMNWCAGRDFAKADTALNEQWRITSAKMKRRDAAYRKYNAEGDGRRGYFASLLEAQRAWLAYRDAHCRVDGYSARGGSLEPLLVSTCKTALTQARTKELNDLANSPY